MTVLARAPHAANPLDLLKVVTWRVPAVDAGILEAVTVPEPEAAHVVATVRAASSATEAVYLPTCQRALLAVVTPAGADVVRARAREVFERRARRELPEPETLTGFEAFAHLSEVASSLDSLVPGEPQILGQMKDAYRRARDLGHVGGASRGLGHVFPLVFRTAKAVRANTDLFRGKVSLIPLTLDLVASCLAASPDPRAIVVGTGEIGNRMAALIAETAPGTDVRRVSRSPSRGLALDAFLADPPPADAVRRAGGERPLLVLDLSLPRCVDPAVAAAPGVRLVALDELAALSQRARVERESEIVRARGVLQAELDRVAREYAALPAQRALAEYRRDVAEAAEARYAAGAERFPTAFADPEFRKWFEQTIRHVAHVAQTRLRPPPPEEDPTA